MPKFLKGKNNDDLAPIIALTSPFDIPLQINSFFFFETPECHTAALKPKYSLNFFSNWPVKPISGNKIKPWYPCFIRFFKASKYTRVLPDPVVPCNTWTLKFWLVLAISSYALIWSLVNFMDVFLISLLKLL